MKENLMQFGYWLFLASIIILFGCCVVATGLNAPLGNGFPYTSQESKNFTVYSGVGFIIFGFIPLFVGLLWLRQQSFN
jgi:hypothetical protein